MIQRNPYLALGLTTLLGIGIILALYLTLTDPGPPPETDEERFERVHAVFIEALAGGAAWSGRIEPLGLQSSRTAAHSPGWQISGTGGACDASGSYVIRDRPAAPIAITAPHSQSDANTGELAQKLFDGLNARAAAWNTAPRAATDECESGLDLTTDRLHPFSAFALAFAESYGGGLVVQLHGIEESGPVGRAVEGSAIILGNVESGTSENLLNLADCLKPIVDPLGVLVINNEPGGAGNAQGRVLRQSGFLGFAQIELSNDLRAEMLVNTELRRQFGSCLVAAANSQS